MERDDWEVTVIIDGPEGERHIRGLASWLLAEADLRATTSYKAGPPGAMGEILSAVVIGLTGGPSCAVTISLLKYVTATWLRTSRAVDAGAAMAINASRNGRPIALTDAPDTAAPKGHDQTEAAVALVLDALDQVRELVMNGSAASGSGSGELSEDVLRELARCYPDTAAVRALYLRCHIDPAVMPAFHEAGNAVDYWLMVGAEIDAGRVVDGARRILTGARTAFPGNPAFGPAGVR